MRSIANSRAACAGRGAAVALLARACLIAVLAGGGTASALAASLAQHAKENDCADKPQRSPSSGMYVCTSKSGPKVYFNVPDGTPDGGAAAWSSSSARSSKAPSPAGFPRVDPATQKGRDDVRRKVLADELATEEKLLAEARGAYADGAPAPLPEERTDAEKYRARLGKLRQAVNIHEKNVEALKKEIAAVK